MEEIISDIESLNGEEYIIVSKDRQDILNDMEFNNEEERVLCNAIIDNLEKQAAEGIRDMKTVQIPSIGCIRINPLRRKLRDKKLHLSIIRKNLTKEEYKEHVRDTVKNLRKEIKENDREKLIMARIRRNNKKVYEKYYKTLGRAYAEMFIKSIRFLSIVEHDEEFEEHYRELRDRENK